MVKDQNIKQPNSKNETFLYFNASLLDEVMAIFQNLDLMYKIPCGESNSAISSSTTIWLPGTNSKCFKNCNIIRAVK